MNCSTDVEAPTVAVDENGHCRIVAGGVVFCDQSVRAEILLKCHRRWWPDKSMAFREGIGTSVRLELGHPMGRGKDEGTNYTEIKIRSGGTLQSARLSYGWCTFL